MSVRMGSPKKAFVRTLKAKRSNDAPVEIHEFLISGTDPTSTGTIWQNQMSFKTHWLATGEEVEVYDDGTAMVSGSGEMLNIVGAPAV